MKKSNILILTAFTSLALIGCSHEEAAAGRLPKGGEEVDTSTEKGKNTMADYIDGIIDSYAQLEINGIGITSELSDMNLMFNGKLNTEYGNFEGKASINDVSKKTEIALGAYEEDKSLAGRLSFETLKGNIALDASYEIVPEEDEEVSEEKSNKKTFNRSLDFGGLIANGYLVKDKIYVDGSDNTISSFLDRTSIIADNLSKDLGYSPKQIAVMAKLGGFDLGDIINKSEDRFDFKYGYDKATNDGKFYIPTNQEVVPWSRLTDFVKNKITKLKEIDPETKEKFADELIDKYLETSIEIPGLSFKIYGKKGFGVQIELTKDTFKELISKEENPKITEEDIDKYLDTFEVSAYIYINEKGLIAEAGTKVDIQGKLNITKEDINNEEIPIDLVDATFTLQGTEKVTVTYNETVLQLPTVEALQEYKELKLPEGKEVKIPKFPF